MKKIISVFLTLILLCSLSAAAFAAEDTDTALGFVTDDANVLSREEFAAFEEAAGALSEKYQCGVYIVTLEDYTLIADGEPYDVAEYIYEDCHLGYGESGDGVLIMVSVAGGNCAMVSQGSATGAVGDLSLLLGECVDAYGSNGYADIFSTYLTRLEALFSEKLPIALPAEDVTAAEGEAPDEVKKQLLPAPELDGYVTDLSGLLAADEEGELESKAAELSKEYGCGVYILIVDDYTLYSSGDAYTAAGDLFLACDMGEGADKAGVLLLMSMADRDVTILTNEAGHAMVGPDAKDWLAANYLKYFKHNNWAKGYKAFLTKLGTVLKMADNGKPMTWLSFPESTIIGALLSALAGFGISFLLMSFLRDRMSSVFSASSAQEYIVPGGVNITGRTDTFSHRSSFRRRIEASSSSTRSSSGGSRSSDSRGFSGRSDKF